MTFELFSRNEVGVVDDDDDANFFQEKLIRKNNFAEHVDKACNGVEALEYLNTCIKGKHPLPEIIFLDLKWGTDFWTFLECPKTKRAIWVCEKE